MNSVLPFTYTLSAQVYVNRKTTTTVLPPPPWGRVGVGAANTPRSDKTTACAPAHRHYPNPPTTARIPTALPPPPWGRVGVGAASTPQSDKYKIAHRPYSPTATALPPPLQDALASAAGLEQLARSARKGWGGGSARNSASNVKLSPCNPPTTARIPTALPPSPCGGGAGGGVRPHTSLSHRQPVKPFTYTLTLYVKRTIGCALAYHRIKNAASAINGRSLPPPQPTPGPHSTCGRILNGYPPAAGFALRGREFFRCVFCFRSLNSHNECASAHRHNPNPPTATRTSTTLPPSPAGRSPQRGRAGVGGSAHDFAANAK